MGVRKPEGAFRIVYTVPGRQPSLIKNYLTGEIYLNAKEAAKKLWHGVRTINYKAKEKKDNLSYISPSEVSLETLFDLGYPVLFDKNTGLIYRNRAEAGKALNISRQYIGLQFKRFVFIVKA